VKRIIKHFSESCLILIVNLFGYLCVVVFEISIFLDVSKCCIASIFHCCTVFQRVWFRDEVVLTYKPIFSSQ